ncbi:MAG: phosphate acyltransferase PlsX [Alphaproteobacteria bacterium]|nr:phosphate acyltransferase PlsX [Alphaproteobacteria bacterium]
MAGPTVIALDAMGGDRAPEMVVAGANVARERYPDVRFLLFGDEARLAKLLGKFPKLAAVSQIRPSESVVGPNDRPSVALRQSRNSSMRLAIDAVRSGDAGGVVSAGNTGALMAMAKMVLKTLPGIKRPALASMMPTGRGEIVLLDLGANVECDAENLIQFALMGALFARDVVGVPRPTVGLLNVGHEEVKGHDDLRIAYENLRAAQDLPMHFHGFIEGNDIGAGTVDVVVTDGFTGNIALKTIEGTARLYSEFLRATFRRSVISKLGYLLARPALNALKNRVDPRRYNGGMFLGLRGVAVKSHGGTDAFGFANAIGFAVDMIAHGFNAKVKAEIERWQTLPLDTPKTAAL